MIHLAGISISRKIECFVRPCRPWQGRRLGRRPQQQLTAGLRGAPHFVRRLAFGNPLVGHGGCKESEAQPPVPASQVRKPAGR